MNTDLIDQQSDTISASTLTIRRIDAPTVGTWLAQGWQTFAAAPFASFVYGILFALACIGTLALIRAMPGFTAAFLTGLLLIGPFLAAGLYVAARQHAAGETVSIGSGLALLWERRTNLSLFGVFLGLIMAAWVRLSALLFAVKVTTLSPTSTSYLGALSGSFEPVVTGYFVLVGVILAFAVFVTSAVTVPLIIDRDAGPIVGIQTSWKAVARNPKAMALWAGLIVALTAVGILTAFVAMVVLFPLLGYATWYSYRSLVQ